ncbi:hypothetical protein PG985_004060 [Apiospora marii]|uniref:Uncharacterized protein n=1 Tax=Apiospora marii TaxID=335849 RepID=A0ABR1SGB8_9PEZI
MGSAHVCPEPCDGLPLRYSILQLFLMVLLEYLLFLGMPASIPNWLFLDVRIVLLAIFVRAHSKLVLDATASFMVMWRTHVTSNNTVSSGYRSKQQRQQKRLLTAMALLYLVPLVSAVFTESRLFRILIGIGALGSAVTVIPLRTLPNIPIYALVM